MRKSFGLNSAVTAAFLILCSASGSNAEPDAAIEHAPAPVEAAQGPNRTVVPDRDANGSTAQTENDAAKNLPSVSIAPANSSCETLNSAAASYGLPIEFFARLIRQESNFDPNSVSRAGAQGIAQFMPGTARWRGLSDPFEPTEALFESARWLSELRNQFGNLGLAAAAYNAGPRRVKDWIAGRGQLPRETRAYVRIITGRAAEEWVGVPGEIQHEQPAGPCIQATKSPPKVESHISMQETANWAPWGIQLISNSSETKALAEYKQLQKRYQSVLGDRAPLVLKRQLGGRGPSTWYFVRVAESSQQRANQLCSRLASAGGSCLVSRN
jgi:transglycosylase-like protein with SLT domain/sporulation related protein